MRVLVTGGAGFIGRWVVQQLLDDGQEVWILDNLSNGELKNLQSFEFHPGFKDVVVGDVRDGAVLDHVFDQNFDLCLHLAARINVQESLDDPSLTFENDTVGTFQVLENCRRHRTKMVFVSSCMVYDRSAQSAGIRETDRVKLASPYAGAKLAAESLVTSYYHAYGLPTVIVRPFNTYGPFQKSSGEGGVVSIFLRDKLTGEPLRIYGDGTQTRDFLYVEDCARFITQAGYAAQAAGEIIHAGMGRDISINDLAKTIGGGTSEIQHVPHIHLQSEIQKLLCNPTKAKTLLNWEPTVTLEEGISRTEAWLRREMEVTFTKDAD